MLQAVLVDLDAVLIDCRFKPTTRKKGFGGRQLEALLGQDKYRARGSSLGGFGHVTRAGLDELEEFTEELGPHAVLMCMEEAPGECHRHHDIGVPLFTYGIDVMHLFRDEAILAADLMTALVEDGEYDLAPNPLSPETIALLSPL